MTSPKIKGRYFFGVDAATSIVPQAGSGSLVYTGGSGGATFYSNYVDLKTGSLFATPFNSVSHDRTIIIVGMLPFYEQVYDGDSTYKFPPVVSPVASMSACDYLMAQAAGGYFTRSGTNLVATLSGGSTWPATSGYENSPSAFAYRDSSFTIIPQAFILGQGANGVGTYLSYTSGRNHPWLVDTTAYTTFAAPSQPMIFGHCTNNGAAGSTALAHVPLLAYAEYSRLTPAELALEMTDMVALLEARGWTGLFHKPFTSDTRPADNAAATPPTQPAIVAANANFTVTNSPTTGWKRITKTGGTNGTMERAAYTATALVTMWNISIADPVSGGTQFQAGVTKAAGPNMPGNFTGFTPNGASPSTYMANYGNGVYGSAITRVQGEIYGVTRGIYGNTGYISNYIAASPDGASAVGSDFGNGQTDAAVPMIFDCALATVGGYIDVKIS